jgi:acyl-CoA thioester hydrolase
MKKNVLISETLISVRFSEVDSMGVVWHGNYVKYFEDGREGFGSRFGITYLDFYGHGVLIPIVSLKCDFKKPLVYGDTARVVTKYINCESAKIQYEYAIFNNKNQELAATGSSIQVFLDLNRELLLSLPAFFVEWKKQNGLL